MVKASKLLEKAAELRDMARRALRLAAGLLEADRARLTQYSEDLRKQADELERQAAAEISPRPPDPDAGHSDTHNGQWKKKQSGGTNDPGPQS
jgi:hypothetical protein